MHCGAWWLARMRSSSWLTKALTVGAAAALVAVWPVGRGASLPVATIAAIALGGVFFCLVAAQVALRGRLIEAIRSE